MQYESAFAFFPADKVAHDKPGNLLSMANPPAMRSPTETPRGELSDWRSSDVGTSSASSTPFATAFHRPEDAPVALKFETPFHRQAEQQQNQSGAASGDLRAAHWMWGAGGEGLRQQDVSWHARQQVRAASGLQSTPSAEEQMSFAPSSSGQLACLGSPWLPADSEAGISTFPISSADASALTPIVSSTSGLHNPATLGESDLFANPFEGVSMPICSPRGFPLSPVHMEGFPPYLTTAVAVEGEDSLPTFSAWESRSSPDSACAYNLGFRPGPLPVDGGKLSDGMNGTSGGMELFQSQQVSAWMGTRADSASSEFLDASNTIHSSLRRRPRSEIITEADFSSFPQRDGGKRQAAQHARDAVAAVGTTRMTPLTRTTVMHQQPTVVSQSTSCVPSSAISTRPLPVTSTDRELACELIANKRSGGAGSINKTAKVQLLTLLNDCYWKNGRKNLQCFPSCPEHSDFYSMKMNNRKHSSVGVCRGPVYCHVLTSAFIQQTAASTPPASSSVGLANGFPGSGTTNTTVLARHMKYELGVGASSSGGGTQELFVLGRFERVPQQQENTSLLIEHLSRPPTFETSASFEQFRYSCFQAVEMEERRVLVPVAPDDADRPGVSANGAEIVRSTWFFLPDVWKVRPMLKKKRKATRSAPAQTFPFCFRIFVYARAATMDGSGSDQRYECLSSTASSFFELYSTRTVDRVKRRMWSGGSSPTDGGSADEGVPSIKRHATRA